MTDERLPGGLAIERDISLAPLTSWVVGGAADCLLQPRTVDDLRESVAWAHVHEKPITLFGGGTNVLISDNGVRGVTISLRKMAQLTAEERDGELKLTCLAGTSKSELLKVFLKYRLEPALFLAGLPGDVGGGVVMNAGVGEMMRPREFTEITEWVEILRPPTIGSKEVSEVAHSMTLETIPAKDLQWDYRHCEGWKPGIITRVGLRWELKPSPDVLVRVRDANKIRLSKQPLDLPSCGSVFRNPPGTSAGRLIEECGLKGYAIGGAKISEKHANFIVNFNKARADDIRALIEHAKKTVLAKTGIELRTEVVYLGS